MRQNDVVLVTAAQNLDVHTPTEELYYFENINIGSTDDMHDWFSLLLGSILMCVSSLIEMKFLSVSRIQAIALHEAKTSK